MSIAVIFFREVLEIALILGVVLVATRGLPFRGRWILIGLGAGLVGSGIVAYSAGAIADAVEGVGQEIFNAGVLVVAGLLIIWTIVWMKSHARELSERIRTIGAQVIEGRRPLYVIAVVICLAVLREGSEIVLMTYGAMLSGSTFTELVFGSLAGLVAGAAVGAAIYFGLIRMSARYVFTVTSVLLAFLAAGMMSQAVNQLTQAGFLSVLTTPLWDTSSLLSESNVVGRILHALVGYTARPTGVQLIAYAGTLVAVVLLVKRASRPVGPQTEQSRESTASEPELAATANPSS